jgi:hypothetical protein
MERSEAEAIYDSAKGTELADQFLAAVGGCSQDAPAASRGGADESEGAVGRRTGRSVRLAVSRVTGQRASVAA